MVGLLPIWIVKANVSSVDISSERSIKKIDKGPTLKTLDCLLSIMAVHKPFYILICISEHCLPQHTKFIYFLEN